MEEIFSVQKRDHALYIFEKNKLFKLLNSFLSNVEIIEIGSTAVDGVIGKEDIDVLVKVDANQFIETRRILDTLFNRNHEQLSDEMYQGYKVPSQIDVSIQLTIRNCIYDTFEFFLVALRQDQNLVERYNQLKIKHHGAPMEIYRAAKQLFIETVISAKN